ncbi:B3 domain-containing protein Os02g0598200-like isoform X2 [Solanum dulcamara]|nr:B3 domain-containing protein Os02g0598200-like isoform X2 [Solanum dulcamara]XP_055828253.1 B3 domain-containing protein Os02g0598200-like isoform X2 [Solanum dulcamara]
MEACYDECKKDCLLINGKRVLSFFKVIIEEGFLEVLCFPPKFARSVQHLTDRETYLEDSCGQRWKATVCNRNGSLAIRQGWAKFSSEHEVKVRDFLVFHYILDDQHFIVQIFRTSGCEKINFCTDIGKGKQKARTYQDATTPLLQITSGAHLDVEIDSEAPLPKFMAGTDMVSKLAEDPLLGPKDEKSKEASQFGFRSCRGKKTLYREKMKACYDECKKNCLLINGKRVHSFFKVMIEEGFSEVLVFPPKFDGSVPHLTDLETYLEDSCGRQWRATVCSHNGSLAIRQGWSKFSSEHDLKVVDFLVFHYVLDDQYFIVQIFGTSGCEKINFCKTYQEATTPLLQITSGAHLDVEIDSDAPLPKFMTGTDMVSNLAEDPMLAPKDEKSKEASQFDSGDALFLNAVNFSCLVDVSGRDCLELPESWRKNLLKRNKLGKWIIYLRGPDKRIWPTFYHSRSGVDALTCGWKQVSAACGLNAEDGCLFQLVDPQKRLFDVRKI